MKIIDNINPVEKTKNIKKIINGLKKINNNDIIINYRSDIYNGIILKLTIIGKNLIINKYYDNLLKNGFPSKNLDNGTDDDPVCCYLNPHKTNLLYLLEEMTNDENEFEFLNENGFITKEVVSQSSNGIIKEEWDYNYDELQILEIHINNNKSDYYLNLLLNLFI